MMIPRRLRLLACASLLMAALGAVQAAPGDLDPNFGGPGGTPGKVVTAFAPGTSDSLEAVAVTRKGKILAAGSTGTLPLGWDVALVRYRKDGSLDPTFGAGGKVQTDFGGDEYAEALLLLDGGKIGIAGGTSGAGGDDLLLARYRSDGTLDPGFGDGGRVITDFGADEWASAMAGQEDNRLLVAGESLAGDRDLLLARYLPNGTLDASFGDGGKVITDLGGSHDEILRAVRLQENGRIVVAGYRHNGTDWDFFVARFRRSGALDTSFGGGTGWVALEMGGDDFAGDLVVQEDGRIVIAGTSDALGSNDIALARLNADGSYDDTFGDGGRLLTPIGGYDTASALLLQKNGRIVAAGRTSSAGVGTFNFALVRYNADGTLDESFGTGGIVRTDIGGEYDGIYAVARFKKKLIAAGVARDGGIDDFALARYRLK